MNTSQWRIIKRLLRTTAMKLSLRYAIYLALVMFIGLGVLYWTSGRYIDAQLSSNLQHQLDVLIELDQQEGREQLLQVIKKPQLSHSNNRIYRLLVSNDGHRIYGDLKGWPNGLTINRSVQNIWIDSRMIPGEFPDGDGYWPAVAGVLNDGAHLLVTQSIVQAEDLREFTLTSMVIVLLVTVSIALLLGWNLGKRILWKVDNINQVAKQVALGELDRRVSLSDAGDEFDQLASHLNFMLIQLENSLKGMREATDNIAHDLRSPLSRLRTRIEKSLQNNGSSEIYKETLGVALNEIDQIVSTFNALLEITHIESGSFKGEWNNIDLSTLILSLSDLYRDSAQEKNKSFNIYVKPDLVLTANKYLIEQAICNLLDNALKFTKSGGIINLIAEIRNSKIVVEISDNGIGIPISEHQHVLGRFVRMENARKTPGNGLGLSLVSAVVERHGAKLKFEENDPGLKVILLFHPQGQV